MNQDGAAEKVSVLVVDDSDDQRLLLRKYLERAGCSVQLVATAEEALAACAIRSPELMVIDLILPGMDGWELAKRMRADHPECSIAITSVHSEERYPEADARLPKPFSAATVRAVLQQCIPRWVAA